MVPRRPNNLLMGSVSQQPRQAQARYGDPTTRPVMRVSLFESPAMPKICRLGKPWERTDG